MTSPNGPQPPPPRRTDDRRRERALRLVAEGSPVADAARAVGVDVRTLRRWKATGDGAVVLANATAVADVAFESTVEAARSKLSAAAAEATDVLMGVLRDTDADPGLRLRAASMVFDRVGLPRTQRLETPPAPLDTSKLTSAELDQLEVLLAVIGAR